MGVSKMMAGSASTAATGALAGATAGRAVASEEELEALPLEEDETDVIAGARDMDIGRWVEDEAILSLPLVPPPQILHRASLPRTVDKSRTALMHPAAPLHPC